VAGPLTRVGVLRNPRSHGNQGAGAEPPKGVHWAEPDRVHDHAMHLADFAAKGVDLLVIAGGDGTVRDVLSALPSVYVDNPPVIAVLPAGKTNILALDLGAPPDWSLEDILALAGASEPVIKTRPPLEVSWAGKAHAPVRGFFFGMGGFVRATEMAQTVHRQGAFHNLAVALTVSGAVAGALFGGPRGGWRRGVDLSLAVDDEAPRIGARFLTMATTLKRLPLKLSPFGPPRDGMKLLDIDAPPKRLHAALRPLMTGQDAAWLEPAGYRRTDVEKLTINTVHPLVIDGEVFPGGEIVVRRGEPVRFLAP
jgi:diacylglycerol kinase family enzyme